MSKSMAQLKTAGTSPLRLKTYLSVKTKEKIFIRII